MQSDTAIKREEEMMKEQIPQEKTRSYWEEKVPNPQEINE